MASTELRFDPESRTVTAGGWKVDGPILVHSSTGDPFHTTTGSYSSWRDGLAEATVRVGDAVLRFEDRWSLKEAVLRLDRVVQVVEGASGGFCTEVRLARADVDTAQAFVPGTQYGDPARSNPAAIGGAQARAQGDQSFYIREDRLPAPLAALRLPDGTSLAVLNPSPDGTTTEADAAGGAVTDLTDPDLRFGAISVGDRGHLHLGYVYPGVEGPTTYTGDTFPDGQVRQWRRRFHPLTAGASSSYAVVWRLNTQQEPLQDVIGQTWRWAWATLQPPITRQDIRAARTALFDQLAASALEVDDRAGFPHFRDAVTGLLYEPHQRQADHALMGFTGRSTDCAYYLLREASRIDDHVQAERYRRIAVKVLDSFARMPVNPPVGEGFDIRTGKLVPAAPHQARADVMLLRGLAEGAKSMLRAWREADRHGANHDQWRVWGLGLTDWLLAQQRQDGSLPRSWLLGTATVADASGYSTYNAIATFLEAFHTTGEPRYREAAVRAGEASWRNGQADGVFVGGTLDNPDVIDKEAGTLSLEGYLALQAATADSVWVGRAEAAAQFAETWIYIWDVPMPPGSDTGRGWKTGVTTIGAQLIASGHSLVDQYMAFDVGSFLRLYDLTGDSHYRDVAELLLHNTKTMLALPAHPYDLAGLGWQQEHWSFAPVRGSGLHRGWLPWVTCSQLEGIAAVDERLDAHQLLRYGPKDAATA